MTVAVAVAAEGVVLKDVFMDIKVVPGILEKDFEEVRKKVNLVYPFVDTIQIDLEDGKFVPIKTFLDPGLFRELTSKKSFDFAQDDKPVAFELHMMVSEPGEIVKDWVEAGFKRVIGHIEGILQPMDFLTKVKAMGVQVGLAVDYNARVSMLENYLEFMDFALVMTVRAGFSGQEFMAETLDKVKWLRERRPNMDIEVDGGINVETAKMAKEAGANIFVSTSYIFNGNIKENIEKLKSI